MIVFFETSTLVAASIRALEGSIQHNKYSESKGLINQVAKKEILGITTFNIEQQANNALEKALLDVMELNRPPETIEDFRNYSTILDAIQRMYWENISLLDRLSTDKNEVARIEAEEVYPMYDELDADIRERPAKVYTISPKFMRTAKEINRMVFGRYKQTMKRLDEKSLIPDSYDRTILSEAVYLKRNRFPKQKFCLASLDNHFCGFKSPYTEIPEKIKELFEIECLSPSDIIRLVKKK